jgi:hypothetical protein
MHVVEYGEKPDPQIGAWLPEVLFCKRTHKAALHQIIGLPDVPGQCPSVTP